MQVKWNQKAEITLNAVIEYGLKNFGEKAAYALYQQIKSYDTLLTANPEMGKPEPLLTDIKGNYRSLVVHSHYKLVYHIVGNTLRISDLWDTRCEPERLIRHIK